MLARAVGRFWPSNVFRRPVTVLGPDQVAKGYAGFVDRMAMRGMQGVQGHIPRGNSADPVYRFNGYVDYGQLARTQLGGASTNLRGDPNVAMPATGGPLVVTAVSPANAVMASLANMPPGFR
jgi:hypothetical protein